ncbi:AAA family ATPase [Rhodanobacter denitrificans]|uniref:ATPase family protein associated with various cellular activities (AAA) n=1 Tax=Rhodanobacter denitrificans TaxID=666685 RepID=M4NMW1_9GAMM|nr:AAA family ATPase [Rhodanobacter denitrificans]AGG89011.1 ATPase family protein associated with various cellular activities (AAA) [Rhodanobacter denitrificans]UJJ53040.1 AAA family ATPase [Rhodanobacter denitrificans]
MQFTTVSAKVFGDESPDVQIPAMVREVGQESEAYIPAIDATYTFDRNNLSVVNNFLNSAWTEGTKEGLQLIGPTGSGKTSLIEQVCARLNVPVVSVTAHERMEVPELISSIVAFEGSTMTVDGPLTMAIRNGWPFVLNESDLLESGTATGLNDIIERGFLVIPSTNELVRAAQGFAFIATSNTGGAGDDLGAYVGTKVQNLAFRDRFLKVVVDYMDEPTELKLLERKFPSTSVQVLKGFIAVANMIREGFKAGTGLDVTMSTRTLVRWVRLTGQFAGIERRGHQPIHYAMDLALANGTSAAVSESLHSMIQQHIGVDRFVTANTGD